MIDVAELLPHSGRRYRSCFCEQRQTSAGSVVALTPTTPAVQQWKADTLRYDLDDICALYLIFLCTSKFRDCVRGWEDTRLMFKLFTAERNVLTALKPPEMAKLSSK